MPAKSVADLYAVLGVKRNVEPAALKQAYRRLARKYHPDVNPDPRSHTMMARINEAFETLIDPLRKMEYDAMLAGGLLDQEPGPPPKSPKKPVVVRLLHRFKAHRTPIYGLDFAPDTGLLVSSSFDNEMIWWDARRGESVRRLRFDSTSVSTVCALERGDVVAAGSSENLVSVSRVAGGAVDSWRNTCAEWVSCLAISEDGEAVATGSVHRGLSVSRAVDGKSLYARYDHTESVTAVAWSQDGRFLASGSADATVKLRHGASGAVLHTFNAVRSAVTALAFSPDGAFLSVASVDLSVRVFRLSDGFLQKVMFGHTRPIEALAFHPNGWLFASAGRDGAVKLWNAAEGVGELHLDAGGRAVATVAFSPDGTLVAAAGLDRIVRVWSLEVRR